MVVIAVLAIISGYILTGCGLFIVACYIETEIVKPDYLDNFFTSRDGTPETFPGIMTMVFWPLILIPGLLWAFWYCVGKKLANRGHDAMKERARRAKISPEDKARQKINRKLVRTQHRQHRKSEKKTAREIEHGDMLKKLEKL